MTEFRNRIRNIILAIAGAIIAVLLLRFFLHLFAANSGNALVDAIDQITNPLVAPFVGINPINTSFNIDFPVIAAIVVYMTAAILISEFITGFIQDSFREIVLNVVDAIFKLIEFFLVTRLVLRIFGFSASAGPFVNTIYSNTNWTQGILPTVDILNGSLEFSTIAVIVIVVIVDLATEGLIHALFPDKPKLTSAPAPAAPAPTPIAPPPTPVVVTPPPASPAPPQNITINVPVPTLVPAKPTSTPTPTSIP